MWRVYHSNVISANLRRTSTSATLQSSRARGKINKQREEIAQTDDV